MGGSVCQPASLCGSVLGIVESPSWTGHVSPPNRRSLIVEDQEGTRPKNLRSISPFSKKSSKMFARQRAKGRESFYWAASRKLVTYWIRIRDTRGRKDR